MVFLYAALMAVVVSGLAVAFIAPFEDDPGPALKSGAAVALVLFVINVPSMWLVKPLVGFNMASIFNGTTFTWWMVELLIAIVVVAGFGATYDAWTNKGMWTIAIAWIVVLVFGILNIGGGVWTETRANKLAGLVDVKIEKIGNYPDTDPNHIVSVPEQVARRAASSAMTSGGKNLSTNYEALDPELQSVDGHAYWIVGLRPSGFISNNKVDGTVPAYIVVDAENPSAHARVQTADAEGNEFAIKYQSWGYFSHQLERHVWENGYAGVPTDDWTLEVDDNWRPYWTASINQYTLAFKTTVPKGELVVDAQTGEIKRYAFNDVPSWVDRIYSADTAKQLLDWWGNYGPSEGYGFFGIGRGPNDRYKVHGDPVLVYTKEGYPVWQMELTSRNSDTSVSYMALFDGRDHTVRLYEIPDIPLEETVVNTVQKSPDNLQHYVPVHLAMHKINGSLTWVAPLVPEEDAPSDTSATLQGIAMLPADYQPQGSDVVIGKNMQEALNGYQTFLNGTTSVKPSEDSTATVIDGVVERVSSPISEKGTTVYYFTLKGDSHVYRVGVDPTADNSNLEVPFIQAGSEVRIGYRDSGTIRRDVEAYDDLGIEVGVN